LIYYIPGNMNKEFIYALSLIFLLNTCNNKKTCPIWITTVPAGDRYCEIDKSGKSVLPNGRFIQPAGKCITVAPHPYGLTLSHDGDIAVTANSGTNPLSITIIRGLKTQQPVIQQIPSGPDTDRGILASVFMGLAISPDNRVVYVSGGQENKICIFDLATGEKQDSILCQYKDENTDYTDGYIGDMRLTKDGKTLYAVDQIGFRLIIIDTEKKKIRQNVPVGRYPFGVCLSSDEIRVFVANVGMFQYSILPGITKDNANQKAWKFPAYEFNSKEAREGFTTNDGLKVPGLGDPNVPESFSVFTINVTNPDSAFVSAKTKTGHLVGSIIEGIPAIGGSSPNSLAATDEYIFVSNGNNDNISVISVRKDTVVKTIYLKPDERMKQFRGIIPFGLAISPDQKCLYVAEAGINAVAIISIPSFKVMGHIPAGWFPSKLQVSPDGKTIYICNAKGFGSGPNGGSDFKVGQEGTYIGNLMKGTLQIVEIPSKKELNIYTQNVIDNNYKFTRSDDQIFIPRSRNPVPLYPGQKVSPIRHIVFISKENRTYDEVFGQVTKARGDSSLARYGTGASFSNATGNQSVERATIMPNHLRLANRFAMSDNFYVDSDHSADGHRWLVNTYPNEWTETCTSASYGDNRDFKPGSTAPGIFTMNGAAGAIYPEDYNEAGSMWDHLLRNNIDFYNFGFSIMFEPGIYDESYKYEGIRHFINFPLPQGLYSRTSRSYSTYNMAIPDQFRVDQFIKEFTSKYITGNDSMPDIMTIILPNDHGAGDRPEAGYPFRESYMADNDLAVGRTIEFLTHTPYWKNMLIVITEDDSQNGVDHIDAHRSILIVISPYARKNYVGHKHYSFGSIFKTFWNILGLPYLNQYDAGATDLSDLLSETPDFTPYIAVAVDLRVFNPQKALDPFDEDFNWKALQESPGLDNVEDLIRDSKEKPEYR
jgi:DNA-binding beta-propeller fold protein YncE